MSFIQDLGYRGEIGYQTFLYSNTLDIRKVFMFLTEKLPKEHSDEPQEQAGIISILTKNTS